MIQYIEDGQTSISIYSQTEGMISLNRRCLDYLEDLCLRNGSTYEGRRQAACSYLHIRQKAPIYIREGLLLFPSRSAQAEGCVWLNYCAIQRAEAQDHMTRFIFHDGQEMIVDMQIRSALLQMRRCLCYLYALESHAKEDAIIV